MGTPPLILGRRTGLRDGHKDGAKGEKKTPLCNPTRGSTPLQPGERRKEEKKKKAERVNSIQVGSFKAERYQAHPVLTADISKLLLQSSMCKVRLVAAALPAAAAPCHLSAPHPRGWEARVTGSAAPPGQQQRRRHCAFHPELKKDGWGFDLRAPSAPQGDNAEGLWGGGGGGGGLDKTFPEPICSSGPGIKGDEGAGTAPGMKAETGWQREDPTKSRAGLLLRPGRIREHRSRGLKGMGTSLEMFLRFPGLNMSRDDRMKHSPCVVVAAW